MLHLEVEGCAHGGLHQVLIQVYAGRVHEVEQDGEARGVHFAVQGDHTEVSLLRVHEDRVEEPTKITRGKEIRHTTLGIFNCALINLA